MSANKVINGQKFEERTEDIEAQYSTKRRYKKSAAINVKSVYGYNYNVEPDAYFEDLNIYVEKKFQGAKRGTTIEKIPYVFEKIEDGVYGENPHFIIISVVENKFDKKRNEGFKKKCQLIKLNQSRPNFANVHYFTTVHEYECYLRKASIQICGLKTKNGTILKRLNSR